MLSVRQLRDWLEKFPPESEVHADVLKYHSVDLRVTREDGCVCTIGIEQIGDCNLAPVTV